MKLFDFAKPCQASPVGNAGGARPLPALRGGLRARKGRIISRCVSGMSSLNDRRDSLSHRIRRRSHSLGECPLDLLVGLVLALGVDPQIAAGPQPITLTLSGRSPEQLACRLTPLPRQPTRTRSEERRVGKEC